jgi:sigma-B regulation protein RsbU (phosphoserine phosphatase)
MTQRNDKYFTIWYGVYNRVKRQLTYASAGHPPAVLLSKTPAASIQAQRLQTRGLPIGMFPEVDYLDECCEVAELSTLYIFSDGIYEINQADGTLWGLDPFVQLLADCKSNSACNLDNVLHSIKAVNPKDYFDDDLSLLEINFD